MSRQVSIVAVTSLMLEASIARRPGVSVLCGQTFELGAALRTAIARGASGVISFGIAGGLVQRCKFQLFLWLINFDGHAHVNVHRVSPPMIERSGVL
jgi:hypothetical protein